MQTTSSIESGLRTSQFGASQSAAASSDAGKLRLMLKHLFVAAVFAALALPSRAADWPQFRGPDASGVEATKPLPVEWNVETGQNVRWQIPLPGLGHASPIISGDRIYVATAVGPGDDKLKVGLYGDIAPLS